MHIAVPIHNEFICIFLKPNFFTQFQENVIEFQGNEIEFRGNSIEFRGNEIEFRDNELI